ncbi:hypothetical protein P3G55_16780 [Leptospira sp. 96542]|nr:hypothetical protein [Leptospira sp. 96542]
MRDIEICRTNGRKIYWKMQNLLWKDSAKVHFLMYLDMQETNQIVENYINESKSKQYESILLDRKGELQTGLKKGSSFLRIYNKSGILVVSEYLEKIDEEIIRKIHETLKKEI